jgi:hypothetical protein
MLGMHALLARPYFVHFVQGTNECLVEVTQKMGFLFA